MTILSVWRALEAGLGWMGTALSAYLVLLPTTCSPNARHAYKANTAATASRAHIALMATVPTRLVPAAIGAHQAVLV